MKNQAKANDQCRCCGQFFRPHPKAMGRQKVCNKVPCRRAAKARCQKVWSEKNPDYFKDRYSYIKGWRKKRPNYQKEWRAKRRFKKQGEIQDSESPSTPVKSTISMVPEFYWWREIKVLERLIKPYGSWNWVLGTGSEIQVEVASYHPSLVVSTHAICQELLHCGSRILTPRVFLQIKSSGFGDLSLPCGCLGS